MQSQHFPGGSVGKNPPANAGDAGSIAGPGVSHTLGQSHAKIPAKQVDADP